MSGRYENGGWDDKFILVAKKRRRKGRRQPGPAKASPRGSPPRDGRRALLLALLAFLVYNANFRLIASGDTYSARFLPFALWNHGTLYFDPIREIATQKSPVSYWIQPARGGHSASLYPVVVPVVVSSIYAPAALWIRWRGETYDRMSILGELMEKLSASCVAAAAVGWMYLLLRRRLPGRDATLLTLAFAFGTNTWVIGSQALWQHGVAELLIVGALWFITAEPSPANVLAAGAFTGLIAANRPPDLLLAAGFSAYALYWARRRTPLFVAAAAVPVLLTLAYNLTVFGRLGGGYGFLGANFFWKPLMVGIAGLLVSPARGLFVFSPFLIFLPIFFLRALRDPESRIPVLCLTAGICLQIMLYAKTDWRAGFSWGYRFLTDAVPILIWMLAPVLSSLGRGARAAFAACLIFSIWVQSVGAFRYMGMSDLMLDQEADTGMRNVWKIEKAPILVEARQPLAPPELLGRLRSLGRSEFLGGERGADR